MISEKQLLEAIVKHTDKDRRFDVLIVAQEIHHPVDMEYSDAIKKLELLGIVKRETPSRYIFTGI